MILIHIYKYIYTYNIIVKSKIYKILKLLKNKSIEKFSINNFNNIKTIIK